MTLHRDTSDVQDRISAAFFETSEETQQICMVVRVFVAPDAWIEVKVKSSSASSVHKRAMEIEARQQC